MTSIFLSIAIYWKIEFFSLFLITWIYNLICTLGTFGKKFRDVAENQWNELHRGWVEKYLLKVWEREAWNINCFLTCRKLFLLCSLMYDSPPPSLNFPSSCALFNIPHNQIWLNQLRYDKSTKYEKAWNWKERKRRVGERISWKRGKCD